MVVVGIIRTVWRFCDRFFFFFFFFFCESLASVIFRDISKRYHRVANSINGETRKAAKDRGEISQLALNIKPSKD